MSRPMKQSGVDWLGDIPADWNVVNIRKLFSFGKGLPITKDDLRESGLPVISYGQIHSKLNSGTTLTPKLIRFVDYEYLQSNPQSQAKRGDFIFADTSEDLTGCGNCVYVNTDEQIFAGYHTIILLNKICSDNKYFAFLFQSDSWRKQIRERVNGVKLFSISQKILRETSVLVPPLDEQQRIANFLDDKCARIDSVIEKTRASIDEYKKLKQAIITRAVTRGIRPARPTKFSGVDWLGEVPDDWEIVKLKHISRFMQTKYNASDGNLNYIGLENIVGWSGAFIETDSVYDREQSLICEAGDILFGKLRPYLAKVYLNKSKQCCSGEFAVIRMNDFTCRKFFYYQLMSHGFIFTVDSSTYGTKMPRANAEFIKNICVIVPPLDEQKKIAAYLDEKTAAIDSLIAKKNQLASELERLKKSLIFEYVTGKKELAQ